MGSAPNHKSRKYGQPLFAVCWPHGELLFVAGGGGAGDTGIANRIIAVRFSGGELSDEVASVHLKDVCERIAFRPRSQLVLAVGDDLGLLPFHVDVPDGVPQFIVPQDDIVRAFVALSSTQISAIAFSNDGKFLAVGSAQGELILVECGEYREISRQAVRDSSSAGEPERQPIKDVDFAPLHANGVVAVTSEGGECYVIQVVHDEQSYGAVAQLHKPSTLKNSVVRHCRFQRRGTRSLYASINYRGHGWIGQWKQSSGGQYVFARKSARLASPITGLDIAPEGALLAACTAEGHTYTLDSATLRVTRSSKAHMVFGTALAFARDGNAFVSVSGDSSATVSEVAAAPQRAGPLVLFCLLLVLVVAAVALVATADERLRAAVRESLAHALEDVCAKAGMTEACAKALRIHVV